ncbi:MAG: hypothetical protein K1060chlam1_01171 [Candidatus Anoxychlamydiales bacterium]|nr:hypothetical protein [Candidatus Anoxychlamydiales bacterium]
MENYNFKIDEKGVWYLPPPPEDKTPKPIWICSPLNVIAITRDHNNENHGRLLQFYDSDNKPHEWPMPMELLAGDGTEYRKALLSMGLQIAPGRKPKDLLTIYIQTTQPPLKARCVNKTGWFENVYVFPNEVISNKNDEKIIFQGVHQQANCYESKGSLEDWQKNVSFYCADNSRLSFAVSISFASVLLHLMEEESGGIIFKGPSSIGKTTALRVAASVFGNSKMIHSCRATSNGLEAIAAFHNDSILCLDEMGQLNAKEAGEITYMLANNTGKSRSSKIGFARKKQEWRLFFLLSGEIGLSDLLKQAGQKVKAGQEVRMVDISAGASKHGIFECLHDFKNGDEFSRSLNENVKNYYGVAGKTFIKKIIENPEDAISKIKKYCLEFTKKNKPLNADGQVLRVLHRFALIAAAGNLATEYGITKWPDDESFWAASECFNSWIENRGGTSAQEEKNALIQIRHFFELHGDSKFSSFGDEINLKVMNRAGYKRFVDGGLYFYVFVEAFRTDICNGIDPKLAAKICIEKGWLIPDSGGKSTRAENLPCSNQNTRCYKFNGEKMFADDI